MVVSDEVVKVHPLFHSPLDAGNQAKLPRLSVTRCGPETQTMFGDVQIKDCDGLGVESHRLDYTRSKRRRSIEAIASGETPSACLNMDGPSSSPLKYKWDASDFPTLVEIEKWEDIALKDQNSLDYEQWIQDIERRRISD